MSFDHPSLPPKKHIENYGPRTTLCICACLHGKSSCGSKPAPLLLADLASAGSSPPVRRRFEGALSGCCVMSADTKSWNRYYNI